MSNDLLDRYNRDAERHIYNRLVETYRPLVYSVCRRYLRDPNDVEDAAQETFLKLARQASAIHGSVTAWLTATAYSSSVDLIRRQSRERRRRQEWGRMGRWAMQDRVLHEAIGQRLWEALAELDEGQRQLIVERFVNKTPLRALAMGKTSVATMSRRVGTVLQALAAVLRDMGVKEADEWTLAETSAAHRRPAAYPTIACA